MLAPEAYTINRDLEPVALGILQLISVEASLMLICFTVAKACGF